MGPAKRPLSPARGTCPAVSEPLTSPYIHDLHLESQGRFSLDDRAAVEKMRSLQAAEPALFLLRAVQACVTLGALSIEIRLLRDRVSLRAANVSLKQAQLEGRALEHWRSCIHALRSAGGPFTVLLEGEGFAIRTAGDATNPLSSVVSERPLNAPTSVSVEWTTLAPSKSWRAAVHHSLARRAALCPVPVTVDGRLVSHGRPELLFRTTAPPLMLGEGAVAYKYLAERSRLCRDEQAFALSPPATRRPAVVRWTAPLITPGGNMSVVHEFLSDEPLPEAQELEDSFGYGVASGIVSVSKMFALIGCINVVGLLPGGVGYVGGRVMMTRVRRYRQTAEGKLVLPGRLAEVGEAYLAPVTATWDFIQAPCYRAHTWVGLSPIREGPSQLFPVRDGVLLNPKGLAAPWGTFVVLGVAEEPVDISGLALIGGEELVVRAEQEAAELEEVVRPIVLSESEACKYRIPFSCLKPWRARGKPRSD